MPGVDFDRTKSVMDRHLGSVNLTQTNWGSNYQSIVSASQQAERCHFTDKECVARVNVAMNEDNVPRYLYFDFDQNMTKMNLTNKAPTSFKLVSRFAQNITTMLPLYPEDCYENIRFANKKLGLTIQFQIG